MPARKLEWKKIKADDQGGTPLLITPLIDIMFLLLIFFVMNTSFNKLAPLDINLPDSEAQSGNVQEQITLLLTADEQIIIGGVTVEPESLTDYLIEMQQDTPGKTVMIAGDEHVSYAFLVHVMDKVSQAGLQDITLLTEND